MILIALSLIQESTSLYESGRSFQQVLEALPAWANDLLNRFVVNNLGDVQERLSGAIKEGSQFLAAQALPIGQGTARFIVGLFVMLYLHQWRPRVRGELCRNPCASVV